jgi:hypothetical protein
MQTLEERCDQLFNHSEKRLGVCAAERKRARFCWIGTARHRFTPYSEKIPLPVGLDGAIVHH